MLFDENEEDFLARIPYPEALSRDVLHVGETWKLYLNVDYLRGVFSQDQSDHDEAVKAQREEQESDLSTATEESRVECISEISTAINRILENNPRKDWESEIDLFFEELE